MGRRIAATASAAAALAGAVWLVTAPQPDPNRPGPDRTGAAAARIDAPPDDAAGVCVLSSPAGTPVRGTLLFRPNGLQVEITGSVEGLPPGRYRFEISEFGDARGVGTGSLGEFFYARDADAALLESDLSLADLMSFEVDAAGTARVNQLNPALTLYGPESLIGRALVVYGRDEAKGSAAAQVAFGVIGRANPRWASKLPSPLTGHGEAPSDRC